MISVRHLLAAALATTSLCLAQAADVAGISFDDRLSVGGEPLVLNGAGVRTKFFFKVYAMGLYLRTGDRSPAAAIAEDGVKRIRIVTLRDLTAEQFSDGLVDGIRKNHDDAAYAQLSGRVEAMRSVLLALGKAPEGTEVILDLDPATGTRMAVDGRLRGDPITGKDFQQALLRVWLGADPADAELKAALAPGR
ncbi:MAG: chalcone isomerase family protein [Rhodocyclaceae bacterium]|nr:chalcone isomerase family protein [Rhodocyclaceae bacterium]